MSRFVKAFAKSDQTDAVLVVDGQKLHVNKAHLSIHSEYFDTLFNSKSKEKSMKKFEITDVDVDDLAIVLSLVHTKRFKPTEEYAEELLEVADRFQLTDAKRHLEMRLMNATSIDRLDKLRIAGKYKLRELFKQASSVQNTADFKSSLPSKLLSITAPLLGKSRFSDIRFKFAGSSKKPLPAHKFVLAARTNFWKLDNDVKEIQIPDDVDLDAFSVAMRWIYTDHVDLAMEDEKLLKVCETAANFQLEELKNVCVQQLASRRHVTSLCDMPMLVLELIMKKLDYKHQLILRKVSKPLRAFVDNVKPACKSIYVEFLNDYVCVKFNNHCVVYKDAEGVRRGDFVKAAFDDLTSTLKNPKLQLDQLMIYMELRQNSRRYFKKLRKVLKSLNHQVSVKEIELNVPNHRTLLSILPHLEPGFLEKIWLIDWKWNSAEMEQVTRLDQWKRAGELRLWDSFDGMPMEYATHFKHLHISEKKIDDASLIRLKEFLSKLDNFEQCTLFWETFSNSVYEFLGAPVSSSITEGIFHHPIPDSDFYFEFRRIWNSNYLTINKKKRKDI